MLVSKIALNTIQRVLSPAPGVTKMVLRHEFSIEMDIDFAACFPCLCSPVSFFAASPYTYRVRKLDEKGEVYEVVFRWRKLGMTRCYPVRLRVRRKPERNRVEIVYESTPDSRYEFYMRLLVERLGPGKVRVSVSAWMRAGLMADLLGRKEYRLFVENLVRDGVFCSLERPRALADATA